MDLRRGYKETEVGAIPEEWQATRLREVAEIRSGIAKNANTARQNPVRVHYLRVANVQDGFLDLSDMAQLEVSASDLQRFSVLPGDVLMNEGGDRDKLGRGTIWRGEFHPCVHQNHVFVVRCGQGVVPEYVTLWSAGTAARKYFQLAGGQTTNLASISKSSLGELPVALPGEGEQRAIAAALRDVDALLEGLTRLIAKKRDLKQAAMQQLLTGQTRLPSFHGSWEARTIGDIAPLQRGFDLPSPTLRPGPYPVVYSNGILQHHAQFKVAGPGVVTGRSGTIGRVTFVNGPFWPHNTTLWVTRFNGSDERFVFYLYTRVGFARFATGSGVPTLNRNDVHAFEIEIPPTVEEQRAIAAVLADIDAELAALEARRDKTRALKQAMMQELLTGRTRLV